MTLKILPVAKPFIYGYKHHAIPLSLFALDEKSMPWIYSNYIQLYVSRFIEEAHWLDFYVLDRFHYGRNPCFNFDTLDRSILLQQDDPVSFIIKCIEMNKYVYIWVDHFYIPYTQSFNRNHDVSNLMIHGVNKKENYFMVTDYSYSTKLQYESLQLSFSDFINAFTSNEVEWRWGSKLNIFHLIQNPQFDFNINLVTQLLEDYLLGQNHSEKCTLIQVPWRPVAYGTHVYRYLYQYLDLLLENTTGKNILPFHLLWEHKRLMCSLIKYLELHNYINNSQGLSNRYMKVEELALTLRNIFLKLIATNDNNNINKISIKLKEIESIEHDILSVVLEQLKRKVTT